ncbi:MAG: 4Fe-4S dicluster domain-containing protein [Candidatus Poribacteria bacterium]|nr:4Fe-4S dicluster domain-containing protein [Candidatus Poribacteria bacterium]MDE0505119.1 4Fe-4S dicluster domain-containing protein [Candidatus Poribacteria bacterium]
MTKSDDSTSSERRAFFKQAVGKLMNHVAGYLDEGFGDYLPTTLDSSPNQTVDLSILRPPGALSEAGFLDTCQRCGHCVESCPAEAIQVYESNNPLLSGTPYIDPNSQPCVVCTSLACMQVCPSGALQPLAADQIQIGLAEVNYDTCLRTQEVECTYCVDRCPMGETAIRLDTQNRIQVIASGCVGCGVCQYECPTAPKSIVVKLMAERTSAHEYMGEGA